MDNNIFLFVTLSITMQLHFASNDNEYLNI